VFANYSYYSFFRIEDPEAAKAQLEPKLLAAEAKGTVLIAHEGVNLNVAGLEDRVCEILTAWLQGLSAPDKFADVVKTSYSEKIPFRRLKVRIKKELCALGFPELDVPAHRAGYISAQEFRQLLESPREDVLILDNRNNFEYSMGTFRGAQPANTRRFRRFAEEAEKLPKDKEVVMFCTGGIRCEKAGAYLVSQGFHRVRQLHGGILKYFEEEGGAHFEGRCFVFDDRESVDGELAPQIDS
jgi:UPF0176 protein